MLAKQLQGAAKSAVVDSDFENVTLLLHGNGTNGAQNNTFIDGSSNAFSITRNGNTTQGTFSPYGDNWSNYFDGAGDNLKNTSAGTAFQTGTGNFTIEFWFRGGAQNAYAVIFESYVSSGAQQILAIQDGGSGNSAIYVESGNIRIATSSNPWDNVWHHHAIVRNGSTVTYYIDGVSNGTYTTSVNVTTGNSFILGEYSGGAFALNGYLSNFRFVKGTAVYTAAFTPPTAPLTAITNTSLLTCQSNRFIDNSTNAFTITRNGDVSVQRFSPFSPTAAYASGTIGGSGYFDGTGDYLNLGGETAFAFGTGDFTIEMWVYFQTLPASGDFDNLIDFRPGGTNGVYPTIYLDGTAKTLRYLTNSADQITGSTTIAASTWYHVVVARSGTSTKMFLNGTQEGSTYTDSNSYLNGASRPFIAINSYNNSLGALNGYISNLRILKGTAAYTSNFTPPTAPVTAITNTSLLCNFTNAGIIDNAMMNDLETVGNAQISTSVSKFGGGSMYFDGSGDWLLVPSSQNFNMGTGDWTVECWAYASVNTARGLFQITTGHLNSQLTGIGVGISTTAGNPWRVYHGTTSTDTGTNIVTSTWIHVAFVRSGSSVKLYLDGTSVYTATDSSNLSSYTFLTVGAWYDSNFPWNGYIDDLRITKGVARYTANFTAPTAPFADQ